MTCNRRLTPINADEIRNRQAPAVKVVDPICVHLRSSAVSIGLDGF
jgi:hypothetical protein